jgi:hypothetical protein
MQQIQQDRMQKRRQKRRDEHAAAARGARAHWKGIPRKQATQSSTNKENVRIQEILDTETARAAQMHQQRRNVMQEQRRQKRHLTKQLSTKPGSPQSQRQRQKRKTLRKPKQTPQAQRKKARAQASTSMSKLFGMADKKRKRPPRTSKRSNSEPLFQPPDFQSAQSNKPLNVFQCPFPNNP